jgi:Tfp pilus assembly PilM family ATPase/Tfp pilus assembly protein PilN
MNILPKIITSKKSDPHKVGLGIYIDRKKISLVQLKSTGPHLKILKASSVTMPKDIISDGCINDVTELGRALGKLLDKSKITVRKAVVAMSNPNTLNMIVDLPPEVPENISNYVKNEIKHSPLLRTKEIEFDYCRADDVGPDAQERIFVAATDRQNIESLLKAAQIARLEITAIDLSIPAFARAIYSRQIANEYDEKVIAILLRDDNMNTAVFERGVIDFIRKVDLENDMTDSQIINKCVEEISAVIKFYEFEVEPKNPVKWKIVIACENNNVTPESLRNEIRENFETNLAVCTEQTIYHDTHIERNKDINAANTVAAGLAMKYCQIHGHNVRIDLLPRQAKQKKETKKCFRFTAAALAVIFILTFITAAAINYQLKRKESVTADTKSKLNNHSVKQLVNNRKILTDKIGQISNKLQKTQSANMYADCAVWANIFDDLRNSIPASVYITKMNCSDNSNLTVEGFGNNYKNVSLFAELLSQSDFINSAIVTRTNKRTDENHGLAFLINCSMADKRINR